MEIVFREVMLPGQRMPVLVPACGYVRERVPCSIGDRCASDASVSLLQKGERYRDTERLPGARVYGAPDSNPAVVAIL